MCNQSDFFLYCGETKMFLLRLIRTVATGAVCVYAVCFKSVSISLDYMIIARHIPFSIASYVKNVK